MLKLANRAKMSTATTGTGTITLGSAEAGYQTFAAAGVVDGDVVRYVIEDGTNWEIGQGTYTASGTTLSRTVLESSNSDNPITLSGSAKVFISAAAEDVAKIQIDTYTTAGSTTWTKPSWAKLVKVIAIGPGGPGGSGGRYATSSDRYGGGGGASGAVVVATFPASYLGDTETVVVGSGGSGGASVGTDNLGGNPGSGGTNTTFGSYFAAARGQNGSGGSDTSGGAGQALGIASLVSAAGQSAGSGFRGAGQSPSTQTLPQPTAGAGGAGAVAASTTGANGGSASTIRTQTGSNTGLLYTALSGGTAGTAGGNGGTGNAADFMDFRLATGGGGGSYATGQATGAGGNGAQPGGGGGGGAASDNGFASGAGGNGGDGWVRVISWA